MMLSVFIALACAFLLTFLAVPLIIEIAAKYDLYDLPNTRKIHVRKVSPLGGAAILIGFLVSMFLFISDFPNPEFRFYKAAALIVFFLGLKDDLSDLSATNKLIGQLMIAAILIHTGGLRLEGLYGLFGVYQVSSLLSYGLTYFTIVVIINAFNLIDGVDGLASSLGILSLSVFGAYFAYTNQLPYAMMAFALVGSLLSFLIFNRQPARIFMGDSGSLLIGMVNAILVIRFIHTASAPGSLLPIQGAVALGIAILSIPLFDTLRMFAMRLFMGHSPFRSDRSHVHHLLLNRGFSHHFVTLSCVFFNLLFIAGAWHFRYLGATFVVVAEVGIAMICLIVLYYYRSPISARISRVSNAPIIEMSGEVSVKAE